MGSTALPAGDAGAGGLRGIAAMAGILDGVGEGEVSICIAGFLDALGCLGRGLRGGREGGFGRLDWGLCGMGG